MVSFLGKMAAGADIRGCGRQFIPSLLHFVSFFFISFYNFLLWGLVMVIGAI
jgi:hypothetical protein